MRKFLFVTLACAALLCAYVLPSISAEAPADMELKVPSGTATKTPVMFSHETHKVLDCKTCHHTWDGAGQPKMCAADGCHTDMKAKKGEGSYYAAFHERGAENSCVGCHSKMKKDGAKTGPTACTQCHPKK